MEVSPNALRKETVDTLKTVNTFLSGVQEDTGLTRLKQAELEASLLLAKAQCLNTLVLLNEQTRLKKR